MLKKNSLIKSVKPWIFEMINCNMEKELHIDSMNLKTKMITFAHIVILWQFILSSAFWLSLVSWVERV
jgi:hypothetical protein